MSEKDPEDDGRDKRGIPLPDIGEYGVALEETLPEPPPNKKIHERRPLPLVPTKSAPATMPRKTEHEGIVQET